jgi:dGTP triphosphohydrolase
MVLIHTHNAARRARHVVQELLGDVNGRAESSKVYGERSVKIPLTRIRQDAGQIVRNLFVRFFEAPDLMPAEWADSAARAGTCAAGRARIVCDYIAGMTDRYASAEHRRLFDETPDLRLRPPEAKTADVNSRRSCP